MDEKMRKVLCYHRDEKLNPAHVCKNPKVYLLYVEGSVVEDLVLSEESEENNAVEERLVKE